MTIAEMNFIQRMLYILERYGGSLAKGAATTMAIALICTLLGCVIGFAVGLVQTTEPHKKDGAVKRGLLKAVKLVLTAYVEVFRGTPMMLQAAFIYYGASQLFGINLGMWSAAIIIVSVNTGAYIFAPYRNGDSEVCRMSMPSLSAFAIKGYNSAVVLSQSNEYSAGSVVGESMMILLRLNGEIESEDCPVSAIVLLAIAPVDDMPRIPSLEA